jgi:hypothetical protein
MIRAHSCAVDVSFFFHTCLRQNHPSLFVFRNARTDIIMYLQHWYHSMDDLVQSDVFSFVCVGMYSYAYFEIQKQFRVYTASYLGFPARYTRMQMHRNFCFFAAAFSPITNKHQYTVCACISQNVIYPTGGSYSTRCEAIIFLKSPWIKQ